jgi:hypothetical protein
MSILDDIDEHFIKYVSLFSIMNKFSVLSVG